MIARLRLWCRQRTSRLLRDAAMRHIAPSERVAYLAALEWSAQLETYTVELMRCRREHDWVAGNVTLMLIEEHHRQMPALPWES